MKGGSFVHYERDKCPTTLIALAEMSNYHPSLEPFAGLQSPTSRRFPNLRRPLDATRPSFSEDSPSFGRGNQMLEQKNQRSRLGLLPTSLSTKIHPLTPGRDPWSLTKGKVRRAARPRYGRNFFGGEVLLFASRSLEGSSS